MSVLADFLRSREGPIVDLFAERLGRRSGSEPEVLSRAPELLAMFERSLRSRTMSPQPGLSSTNAINERLRELELLRACIYERLSQAQIEPPLAEVRMLDACISAEADAAVERRVALGSEALREDRHRLAAVFQQAPGFMCFLRGPSLVFELANDAYAQLVGFREIIGRPIAEALPELAGQGFLEILERVMQTGEPFVGTGMAAQLQREPGALPTEVFVDFVYHPIRDLDGSVAGIFVQGHDVTDVKREEQRRRVAEAALRRSEERYRSLFESIDDGFCLLEMITDADGRFVDYRFLDANATFSRHTGLVGAIGRTAREMVPGLDASWFEMYGRVATTGEPLRMENHAPAMDRWFSVYANRVGPPELRQVALVFKDITESKRVAEERERSLAREMAARRQAEEASRLKDEFLATVSHELRTPLNAMLGWMQMLRAGTVPPENRQRALETVERNARAQAQLIEDLLDVSRILAGKLSLDAAEVDLQAVVEAALESVRPAADAKQLVVQSVPTTGAFVMGDSHRLQQVVWNLLSNAVKFTPKGGRVVVRVERRGGSIEITVTDSGQGIAPEFQPHVFERFRQADGGTARVHGGLGLGLSIVRHLVELHGGTVSVTSDGAGRGSTFVVQLPISHDRPAASPVTASAPGTARELDGVQVLLVEDEDDSREMVRSILELAGARVSTASSAEEGRAAVAREPPQVILSDIGMPGEDGYDLIRSLREAGIRVPAIALTAYARAEDRDHALAAGFVDHVAKPVDRDRLVQTVAAAAGFRASPDLG